ncbi:TetR/AcrR family transcriptional regulator [Periweissella ghanensis]|uniref:HTH tetR-type domain-containing protein n=1 Tax=Periweissella ghanensis TaxID=467997 RepID=A0ABN8BQT9_9LACO|nr:TetR/AcrR family transcriptional regulator [Periweissella ghanensis]MCM0600212.1 TetR/AcrR family transcriptional regulator [Periweissella ghanensis]CAH0419101.1 hypothetical protein WGH24286_01548 [Periweissella ghanensis]
MRQNQRVQQTQQKLKDAYITLCDRDGINNVTISNLVKEANLSRGTFYVNYKDLDALLEEIQTELFANILSEFQTKISDNSIYNEIFVQNNSNDSVYLSFSNVLNYIYNNIRMIRVLVLNAENHEVLTRVKHLIEKYFMESVHNNNGHMTPELPDDYARQLLVDCLFSIVIHWIKKPNPESPEEVARIIAASRRLAPQNLIINPTV